MTRDYARKSRSRAKKKPMVSPWLWMTTTVLIGLFVAFLVYINTDRAVPGGEAGASAPVAKPRPAPVTKQPPPPAVKEKEEGVRFDFYRLLPEYEVMIPEEDLQKPELKETPPGKYLLQAGSFSTADDADTRRAQLALLGLVARVHTVTIDNKDTWHRVQLGPFEDLKKLDQARKLLQNNDIEFLLLKHRK
ncbi:SPOR domain-containing protein [Thiohalomonas denitrificans]|uniref:Sporulation related domain-containing protein n=1 Tax=Thiohalomonas denitrificans TaxID=415747 RepID=A0A1G5QYV6_9GAMM|nr:SPOR domain-containing protein [Thiohalomonas denitrificans]SCZ67044.1 Sporulation related domain-containing protein [Thiohalomonas denitrificans]